MLALSATAPVIAGVGENVQPASLRGAYAVNGELFVNTFGAPEGKPLTTGHQDMKPSWSKTGGMLVFFRVTQFAKEVPDWKTAICVINVDGTEFKKLTDGTHTDFNPTWTRDGSNLVVLNRQNPKTRGYVVMFTRHDAGPGDEYAVSDTRIHTYAFSCLKDGRLLVKGLLIPVKPMSYWTEPQWASLRSHGRPSLLERRRQAVAPKRRQG